MYTHTHVCHYKNLKIYHVHLKTTLLLPVVQAVHCGKRYFSSIFPFIDQEQSGICPQDYLSQLPTRDIWLASPWAGCCEEQALHVRNEVSEASPRRHTGSMAVLEPRLSQLFSLYHQNQYSITMFSVCFSGNCFWVTGV